MNARRPAALVTGASIGLGAVVARFLARQDYNLIVTARHEAPLFRAAESMAAAGGNVTAIPGDVKMADHRRALREAVNRQGRLDLLINNASALGPSPSRPSRTAPSKTFDASSKSISLPPSPWCRNCFPTSRSRRD